MYIYIDVFFLAGEHVETNRQNGSTKEFTLSRSESSSSEDASTIAVRYVVPGVHGALGSNADLFKDALLVDCGGKSARKANQRAKRARI